MKCRFLTTIILAAATLGANAQTKQESSVSMLPPNPFITDMYCADPSAHVWKDGRLYLYPSHDIDPPQGCDKMDRYHVFSTDDMVHWKDHGEILNSSQVKWGRPEGGFMWAPDCAYHNGKYYFYFPHPSGTDWNNTWKVGVAVSKYPDRGFKVVGYMKNLGDPFAMIDPCVFIDDDGQPYFYYGGGGRCVGAPLKDNMIDIEGELKPMEGLEDFHEASWVFKRNGIYYMTYADNYAENGRGANRLHYATSTNPLGPWKYGGIYLEPTGCDTSHGSVVEYKGEWYQFYHNQSISGMGNLRSLCVDKIYFNADGSIQVIKQRNSTTIQNTYSGQNTYNSYKGLVMAGYQGWFDAPEDGAGRGWYHYEGRGGFYPGNCTIDLWPEVDEYEKLYKSPFRFEDGTHAYLPSPHDASTVDTHFRWMQEYGIDGVFMQRFVGEISNPVGKNHFDTVLNHAMTSANKYGRAIGIMYDLSGMPRNGVEIVLNDIQELARVHSLFAHEHNPSYLYHNGKPLVTVWGLGFNDHRRYGLKEGREIVEGLKKLGFSVMLGVPTHWRELSDDTESDPGLHALIKDCDIVMPWFVGRYNEKTFDSYKNLISEDMKWAAANKVDYAPLCFPGFSWQNMNFPRETVVIPRNKGEFFWKQLKNAVDSGAQMIYIAMFDEIDEGTAIFKCAHKVPAAYPGSTFVPIEEGVSSDHYMVLAGKASKMLKEKKNKK